MLLAGAVVVGIVGATASPGPTDVGVPALIASAWLLGNYVGSHRRYTADLEAKNRLLEQARVELADRAVTEERLRIARELHDVVTHTMSVVAVHAGTGRMIADDDPAAARQALATIETTIRSALLEMRRMLGILRGSDNEERGALAPAPGLGDLDALVADVVRSGVIVDVRVEGQRTDVPAGVDLAAYRIVQEALTNVARHARARSCTVCLSVEPDALLVEVADDGQGIAQRGIGAGLRTMQERAVELAGSCLITSTPGAGTIVAARLPRHAPELDAG
jgi:signal transduction histidine kinase